MGDVINDAINGLLEWASLDGYSILLLTVPLAIIQGLFGVFPFATLIMLHISALGLVEGLAMSWLSGTIASVVIFLFFRYLVSDWVNAKLQKRIQRYEKWQKSFQRYGVWAIILLRTLPIMPNNLVSFMSSVSMIKLPAYLTSTFVGTLSHIWMFGIVSSSILLPGEQTRWLLESYIGFCVLLIALFFIVQYRGKQRGRNISGGIEG